MKHLRLHTLAFLAGFVVHAGVLGAMAALLGKPLVQPQFFPEWLRATPDMALLFGGAAVQALLLTWLSATRQQATGNTWFGRALGTGVLLGLLSWPATHLIQAGFLSISSVGWLLEGAYDSMAVIASFVVISWIHRKQ